MQTDRRGFIKGFLALSAIGTVYPQELLAEAANVVRSMKVVRLKVGGEIIATGFSEEADGWQQHFVRFKAGGGDTPIYSLDFLGSDSIDGSSGLRIGAAPDGSPVEGCAWRMQLEQTDRPCGNLMLNSTSLSTQNPDFRAVVEPDQEYTFSVYLKPGDNYDGLEAVYEPID
jgi:hypothetical protein